MNPSAPPAYQSLIDQLLTYDTFDQIAGQFQPDDSFLTPDLLQSVAIRRAEAADENVQPLIWLFEVTTYLYGRKCLFVFLDLPYEEAITYAQHHVIDLATQDNYDNLESLLIQYTDKPDMQSFLKNRQSMLEIVATDAYAFAADWPQRRQLLMNSLAWLKSSIVIEIFDGQMQDNLQDRKYVQTLVTIVNRCQQEGAENVVAEVDLGLLSVQIDQAKGELKIRYLLEAIAIAQNTHPDLWADLQFDLGNALRDEFAFKQNSELLEMAIAAYTQGLSVRTREHFPTEWATFQNNLGITYRKRIQGDRADNIEKAIEAYQAALQIRTREQYPEDWAQTLNNLGNAYSGRIRGEEADNIEKSIEFFEAASQVNTKEVYPTDWAILQNNLGITYRKRIQGDRADNIEKAIEAYQAALQIRTREQYPEDWAQTQFNVGVAYLHRIKGGRADNIENAIEALKATLQVESKEKSPFDWAKSLINLGDIYIERIQGDPSDNQEKAIEAYQLCLQYYTREQFPEDWAHVHRELGNLYLNRIRGQESDNLEEAIQEYQAALQVRTLKEYPEDYAEMLVKLGIAYVNRIRGEQADNIEKSIHAFGKALQVHTKEQFPHEWAIIQDELGMAYQNRIRGQKADNLEKSLEFYANALTVLTKEEYPLDWAGTHNNLGPTYFYRINGDRTDNIEKAIEAYQAALQVYTLEQFPEKWAMTKSNLANSYTNRLLGDPADNVENAIQTYKDVLSFRTRERYPHQWALTQSNLATAYTDRLIGDTRENIEMAVFAAEQALEVYTPDQFPLQCRNTSVGLGTLFYDNKQWDLTFKYYDKAHQAIELLRSESFNTESRRRIAQENATLYAQLIHCCLLLDDKGAAVSYALAGKSRTLTEQLAGERQTLTDLLAQDPSLAQEYAPIQQRRQELDELLALLMLPPTEGDNRSAEELEQQKSNQYSKVVALRQEINTLIDNLVFAHPALSAIQLLPLMTQSDAQALAAALGHVSLVEYIQHAGGWGAFVITVQAIHYVPLADDLLTQISESLILLLNHSDEGHTLFWLEDNWLLRLEQLYQAVFKPLQPYLPSSGQVVLAPTQALHLVPFQALRTEQGSYISESYAFSFVPSLATLRVLHEQSKRTQQTEPTPNRLLNVSHSGGEHNYLDNVRLEAQEVGSQFAEPVFIAEEQATIDRVVEEANKRTYQVVHFNCHGNFLPNSPAHSGLLLAQQQMLTVNDIRIQIRLKGRPLVTLSACQTGQTLPEQGDETTGISWAFLAAGASSVLSSQWSVPDASTRELFSHFYQRRRQGGVSDAEALRQAMLDVRKQYAYRRPVFWAGFQVMGLPIPNNT